MTVVQALRRSWFLLLLPALILGGVGVALASSQASTYTASARLSVGKADPSSASFGGFVTATAGLAAIYSRSIDSDGVVVPVAKTLGVSQSVVRARLTATPVQDTPIIRVIGEAPSAATAQAVADAGSRSLTRYIQSSNRTNEDSTRLAAAYRQLSLKRARNKQDIRDTLKALARAKRDPVLREKLNRSTADGDTLDLRIEAIGGAFTASQQSQAATNVLFPLERADAVTSDRSARLQTLGGAGVLAGLIIGVGLAMWRASRLLARARRVSE
ncbi:MAG: hypothetical protein ACR2NB_01285 [Solirubrobacteraceae bacterium]